MSVPAAVNDILAVTLHPASLILAWLSVAILLQWQPLPMLLGLAGLIIPAALWRAGLGFRLLLRRARWLLLSLFLLFALATPGIPLPAIAGMLGLTEEGCLQAFAHVLRLAVLLALLALLLEHLGIPALIAGLYTLMMPLGDHHGGRRDRIAIRLLLVLEYIERKNDGGMQQAKGSATHGWRHWLDPQPADCLHPPLKLTVMPLNRADYGIMIALLAGLSGLFWWSLQPA